MTMEIMQCAECLKWAVKIDEGSCACCRGKPKKNMRANLCSMKDCRNPPDRHATITVEAPDNVHIEAAVMAVGRIFEAMFHIHGPMCSECIETYLNEAHASGAMETLIHYCASEINQQQFKEDWA